MTNLYGEQIFLREDVIEYEKLLFNAFFLKSPHRWVANNYLLIGTDRLRANIPYTSQKIFCVKENSQIISSLAINFNTSCVLQLEAKGFTINSALKCKRYYEVLVVFIVRDKKDNYYKISNTMLSVLYSDMEQYGIRFLFATCYKKELKLYLIKGFKILQKKFVGSHEMYLIVLDILETRVSKI